MWNWTCSSRLPTSRGPSERGVALPGVLILAAFLIGVTGWMVGHLRTDMAMTSELEEAHNATRLAEAAVQAVAIALGQVVDWTPVDGLALGLPCAAPSTGLVPLDETAERLWLQADTDDASRWGADTPRWQLLWACHGPGLLSRWPSRGTAPTVVVWVADDPEGDFLPLRSTNQRLMLAAVARARHDARGAASATISRTGPGAVVTLLAWHGDSGG